MVIFSPGPTLFPHSLYNFVFPCARVLKMTTMSSAQFIFLVGMTNWNFANLGTLVTEMNKKFFFRAIGGVPPLSWLSNAKQKYYSPFTLSDTVASGPSPISLRGTHLYLP